jgi:hypothetical protein
MPPLGQFRTVDGGPKIVDNRHTLMARSLSTYLNGQSK